MSAAQAGTPISRVDLHLHSRASADTGNWVLRQAVLPESFTEPLEGVVTSTLTKASGRWAISRAPAGHFTRWTSAGAAAGDELVLHGFTHITPGGTSERERAHLSATDIGNRTELGRSVLHGVGLAPGGFVAPCYDHPRTAHLARARSALTWWATRNGLYRKGRRLLLPSLGLGASSALKRATSPSVARVAAAVLAPARSLRLDLHPADLDHRGLLAAAVDVLDRLLDQGRELTTHARLVGAPPQTPGPVGRCSPLRHRSFTHFEEASEFTSERHQPFSRGTKT